MQKNYRKQEARARFFNELMGVQEAAEYKGCGALTVRRAIHEKRLPAQAVGFYFVIPRYALDPWVFGRWAVPTEETPIVLRPQEKGFFDDLITSRQAARLKGVAESSVLKAIKRGRLTGKQIGKPWIVSKEEVEAWEPLGHCPKGWTMEGAAARRGASA